MGVRFDHRAGATMKLLLDLPGAAFDEGTAEYRFELTPYVDRMQKCIAEQAPLSQVPGFRNYSVYCTWPIRQLEYSFAARSLPPAPGGHALDVGSGVTPWPYLVSACGWSTVAVDPEATETAAMQRHGRETFGQAVTHEYGDVRGLSFPDNTFALVTSVSVLEHLQHADVPLALAEMVRVSRPGGRIVFTTDVYAADDAGVPKGRGAFNAKAFERVFGPLIRACGQHEELEHLLESLRSLTLERLREFWTAHFKAGLWKEENRGYGAVGVALDLPVDPAGCAQLVTDLRRTATQLDFPPEGEPYHLVSGGDGTPLWVFGDKTLTEGMAAPDFEEDLRRFLGHFVRPGDVVFDVGANVGHYTALVSQLVGPSGEVHAFEPTGRTFGLLARNVANNRNARLNRLGLSDHHGPLRLLYGEGGNASLNSFGEPFGAGAAPNGEYQSEVVWVTTLDQYIRDRRVGRIDALKIDVEGWEERVLRGGLGTLLSQAPVLTLEYCSPAAQNAGSSCAAISDLLDKLGYQLFRYQPRTRELDPIAATRTEWQFANLIAVARGALADVHARLRGETPAAKAAAPASGEDLAAQMLALLEENRVLRKQLMARALDDEVASLQHQLRASQVQVLALGQTLSVIEADRSARLDVIHRLNEALTTSQNALTASQEALATSQETLATGPLRRLLNRLRRSDRA
jgi:FkbM family methyltransferase